MIEARKEKECLVVARKTSEPARHPSKKMREGAFLLGLEQGMRVVLGLAELVEALR